MERTFNSISFKKELLNVRSSYFTVLTTAFSLLQILPEK